MQNNVENLRTISNNIDKSFVEPDKNNSKSMYQMLEKRINELEKELTSSKYSMLFRKKLS